jgi:hypothetical protein
MTDFTSLIRQGYLYVKEKFKTNYSAIDTKTNLFFCFFLEVRVSSFNNVFEVRLDYCCSKNFVQTDINVIVPKYLPL